MFKILRSKAKIFYWVIAATFILFLFLGGMTSRGCNAPGTSGPDANAVIGSVNGDEITARQYDQMYRYYIQQLKQRAQGQPLNANQYATAGDQAWDNMVNSMLQEQAIEDLDIKVTDQEVLDTFTTDPPQELLQQYRQEDGSVDMNRYYDDLKNPAVDWTAQENWIRSMLPFNKLNDLITADAIVTDEEVREEYIAQTGKAAAEYMGVLYSDLPDDFEPTEAEVQAYYDAHPDDYQRQAKAAVTVVSFKKEAGENDFEEARLLMEEIRNQITVEGKDFATAAGEFGEDGTSANGGDLGTFDRNRMVGEFTEAAFSLPVNEVSQPVRTEFGYHLIEVLEQFPNEETGEIDQVHARHILLKVSASDATLTEIRESAKAFRGRVDSDSFASTAEAEGLTVQTPDAFIRGRDIPGLPLSRRGSFWAHDALPGEISPAFETANEVYLLLAGEKTPAGPAPLTEVQSQVVLSLKQAHKLELAKAKLGPAVGNVQMGRTLAEAAAAAELKHAVTDTFTMNGNVMDVGYGTDFNKLAITGTVGTLIPEVETRRGLYALIPTYIAEFDQADFDARKEGIRTSLLAREQNTVYTEWLEEKREAAEIVDLRHKMAQDRL